MSTTLQKVDEKSMKIVWQLAAKTTENRRWQGAMALYSRSGTRLAFKNAPNSWTGATWVYKDKSFVGVGAAFTWDNLPPNCEMRYESRGEHYRNGTWVTQTLTLGSGMFTGGISTSQSVAAKGYDAGTLTVKVLKHRANATYKIYATVDKSVGSGWWQEGVVQKTFTLNAGASSSAASVQQTFNITGLTSGETYRVTYSIYQIYGGTEYLGASNVSAGQFTLPIKGAYNPGVTITNVEQIPLTHKARVYWTVAEGSTASTYKIFYTNASGTYVDGGTVTVSQNGYNDITVADLTLTRNVSFVVRCYPVNTALYAESYVNSNAVACKMYEKFEWTYPKVQGEKGIVSAEEWNRCKVWVHAKNSDFVIPAETGEYEPITDEAIQDVFDALDLDYLVDDGSAITAAMYNDIADAINEEE